MSFGDASLPRRFWDKAVLCDDGCWEWIGSRQTFGYGETWLDGRRVRVHRLTYETFIGPIPEGYEVDPCQRAASAAYMRRKRAKARANA